MLLAYEFPTLLVHEDNRAEVEGILKSLERDVFQGDPAEHEESLVGRLAELGETRILERLGH